MVSATVADCVEETGVLAGTVWHTLDQQGPLSLARLVKAVDAPRDLVVMAVGWLAREDKVVIEQTPRGRVISLR